MVDRTCQSGNWDGMKGDYVTTSAWRSLDSFRLRQYARSALWNEHNDNDDDRHDDEDNVDGITNYNDTNNDYDAADDDGNQNDDNNGL